RHQGAPLACIDCFERRTKRIVESSFDLDHHQVVPPAAHQVQLASPREKAGAHYFVAPFAQQVGGRFFSRLPEL
ncbi:MAG TPA: hypothetical protein VG009_04030, partial [Candidatus Dormibacteraeota bacterium]|nr:hypothetical protein [Candidatus Dormibacteraeota bacterium]